MSEATVNVPLVSRLQSTQSDITELGDEARRAASVPLNVRVIAAEVAARRGNVRVDEIFSLGLGKRITTARQEVIWRARQIKRADGRPRLTLNMIGRHFPSCGDRRGLDHTTVRFAIKQHAKRLAAEAAS